MIRIDRSAVPMPGVLTSPAVEAERRRIADLFGLSTRHLKQLRIGSELRLLTEATSALQSLFHAKCAYCESPIDAIGGGVVAHFRPRQNATNVDGERDLHHYAWLVLEWENLVLSCVYCDRSKGSKFPVRGKRAAPLASVAECRAQEVALLLDPCHDEPADSLAFLAEGQCRARDERGETTIEVLRLNRQELVAARALTWERVRQLLDKAARSKDREKSLEAVAQVCSDSAPFAAVARAARDAFTMPRRSAKATVAPPAPAGMPAPSPPGATPTTPRFSKESYGRGRLPPYAHHHIRRIEIRDFKAIEYLDLEFAPAPSGTDLAPATVLLGENACGKSTVLEALALTLIGTNQIGALGLVVDDFVRRTDWDAPIDPMRAAEVAVYFHEVDEPVRLIADPKSRAWQGSRESSTIVLGYGPRRFFTNARRRLLGNAFADRVRTMFDPLAVIQNPSRWLLRAPRDDFEASIRALRQLLLLPDDSLVRRPKQGESKKREMLFEVQGELVPLARLSEGYRTVVAMGVDVMRVMLDHWPDLEAARGIVLLDELETHLHPRWKMRIVDRLRRAMPQVQFIATTHDPLCLRGLFDGEAHVLRRDESRGIERVAPLPNVEALSVEQLLSSEFFGLFSTEDPRFERDVARFAELVAKRGKTNDEEQALSAQREAVQQVLTVGATPAAQLFRDAVTEYVQQRRHAANQERPKLRKDAIARVVGLWRSLETADDGIGLEGSPVDVRLPDVHGEGTAG